MWNFKECFHFLARWDECPEIYCHIPGISVGLCMHKNFNFGLMISEPVYMV